MKQFEKSLIVLIAKTEECNLIPEKCAGVSRSDIRLLSAKGLIKLTPAGDNEFIVSVEPGGVSYFADKAARRENFIKEHLVNFISGFVSGVLVTAVGAWLIQWL